MSYLAAIEAGVRHLHFRGLAHNDLSPNNIMVNHGDTPIIIDLGSCRPFGQKLLTTGTVGWIDEDYSNISDERHDESAVRRIRSGHGWNIIRYQRNDMCLVGDGP